MLQPKRNFELVLPSSSNGLYHNRPGWLREIPTKPSLVAMLKMVSKHTDLLRVVLLRRNASIALKMAVPVSSVTAG